MSEKKTLIIVAVGRDRAGLANALTRKIHRLDCTVEDARMEIFGDLFPMLLQLTGEPDDIARLVSQAPGWSEELGLDIGIYEDGSEAPEVPEDSGRLVYDLRVDALERAGIIDDVTQVLNRQQGHVSHLEGQTLEMPFSGETRFVLDVVAEIPEGRLSAVRSALEDLDLDYVLTPHSPPGR